MSQQETRQRHAREKAARKTQRARDRAIRERVRRILTNTKKANAAAGKKVREEVEKRREAKAAERQARKDAKHQRHLDRAEEARKRQREEDRRKRDMKSVKDEEEQKRLDEEEEREREEEDRRRKRAAGEQEPIEKGRDKGKRVGAIDKEKVEEVNEKIVAAIALRELILASGAENSANQGAADAIIPFQDLGEGKRWPDFLQEWLENFSESSAALRANMISAADTLDELEELEGNAFRIFKASKWQKK